MKYKYIFTVFTATYNRAYKIHGVYESLKKQTFKNFEWLIIDDGSTDNTQELIEKWIEEAEFPIRYFKKENGGKHTAYNFGVPKAQGQLLLTLDSDDSCVPEALQVFYDTWESIDNKEEFSGVTAHCFDQNDKLVGDPYPADVFDSDSVELRYLHNVKGEKWGFQRTDIMLSHPFPEINGVKLIPEGMVWDAISKNYKTRFINKKLRKYVIGEDSYSSSGPKKHAYSRVLGHSSNLNNNLAYFSKAPFQFFKSSVHYVRFSCHSKSRLFKNIQSTKGKLLVFIAIPFGFLVFLKDEVERILN